MLNTRENKAKTNVISSLLTILIIGLLIISGPASAYTVGLSDFSSSKPKMGSLISANFTIDMNSNEYINIESITLIANGLSSCLFDVNGKCLDDDCGGITLKRQNSSNAQYGYGYGYDGQASSLVYLVTVNTSILQIGNNELTLKVNTNGKDISSETKTILVSSEGDAEFATTFPINQLNGTINEEFNASINLTFEGSANGNVIIESYSTRPNGTNVFSLPGLNKYLKIELTDNTSAISNETEIRVYYTDAEVATAGLDENRLLLYFYDGTNWVAPLSSGVNITGNYVWAKTNHFSSWGVFESALAVYYGGHRITTPVNNTTEAEPIIVDQAPKIDNNEAEPELTNADEDQGFFNTITGNVIGTTTGRVSLALILILILLILGYLFAIRRKRRKEVAILR